jgi:ferric-dicitrate binding protein FerR (iron transport regulator)
MVQQFPSLMFVRRIPYQTVRRRKIRDLALLLRAAAALALIIAAFARPFLWRPDASTAIGPGAREVVVLLDQSYSMALRRSLGSRARPPHATRSTPWVRPTARRCPLLLGRGHRAPLDRENAIASWRRSRPRRRRRRPRAYGPALKVAGSILRSRRCRGARSS